MRRRIVGALIAGLMTLAVAAVAAPAAQAAPEAGMTHNSADMTHN